VHASPRLNNKEDPLDELFFILMSLRTTFWSFEKTFDRFAQRFKPWKTLLDVDVGVVAEELRPVGFGNVRARNFVEIAVRLDRAFGEVTLAPLAAWSKDEAQNFLEALPGVGAKSARCVMMYTLGMDVVPVDTHTARVGARLGLVPPPRGDHFSPLNAEFDAITPQGRAYDLHTNFVAHGRSVCLHREPDCGACPVVLECPTGSLLSAALENCCPANRNRTARGGDDSPPRS
jgi:endonuclease III